jgi:hypothetical protein
MGVRMQNVNLTTEQEAILRAQHFDSMHPGSLLHDFALVLDYVGEKGVKAGGKYNLLPISAIHPLDAQLARPLRLSTKRPQLRSHPYLQGLHLLLRASELGRVEGKGDKARLVIDPEVLQSWNQLNPTEQYFSLLNAWLVEASPEMVGMPGRHGETVLEGWWYGLTCAITLRERKTDRPRLGWQQTRYHDVYHAALADLFALVSTDSPLRAERDAAPVKAYVTPFGEALATLLNEDADGFDEDEIDDEMQEREGAGESEEESPATWLQSRLQPYFPAWHNTLAQASMPAVEEGVYVFKVSLGKTWRRMAMRHDHTLHDLLLMILESIDFDEDHLYMFTYRDTLGRTVEATHPYYEDGLPADTLELGQLPIEPGDSLSLLYDFGDSWRFKVQFERIDPPGSVRKLPRVLESHGKAPEQHPESDW